MSDTGYEAGDINVADQTHDLQGEEHEYVEGDVNKVEGTGGTAEATLQYLVQNVVDDKDAIFIDAEKRNDGTVVYDVHVSPDDVGKLIGRKGRVIQAMRAIVKAAGMKDGHGAHVEVDD